MSHPLLNDIRTLPDGYQEHLNTALPALPSMPGTEEEANKLCGQLAQYLLNVFGAFEGLHLLKVPYLMGQGNEAVLGLLLASLQTTGVVLGLTPLFPLQEIAFAPGEWDVGCAVSGYPPDAVQTAVFEINGDSVTLSNEGNNDPRNFSGVYTFDVGSYTATFRCVFANQEITTAVSFSVAEGVEFDGGDGGVSGGGGASGGW